MKAFKQYLLVLILGLLAVPSMAGEKMTIDMKEILWGHIKDSYEWHITNVGDHPVVINLPVIVKALQAGMCSPHHNSLIMLMSRVTVLVHTDCVSKVVRLRPIQVKS